MSTQSIEIRGRLKCPNHCLQAPSTRPCVASQALLHFYHLGIQWQPCTSIPDLLATNCTVTIRQQLRLFQSRPRFHHRNRQLKVTTHQPLRFSATGSTHALSQRTQDHCHQQWSILFARSRPFMHHLNVFMTSEAPSVCGLPDVRTSCHESRHFASKFHMSASSTDVNPN